MAAISGMMKQALLDIAPKDFDEMVIIVPDIQKDELDYFEQILYGKQKCESTRYTSLFKTLDINNTSLQDQTDDEIHIDSAPETQMHYAEKEGPEIFKTTDVKKLLNEEPERISFEEVEDSVSHSRVWRSYCQISVDGVSVPFVKCKHCQAVFMQTTSTSNTVIKRHSVQHKNKTREKATNIKKLTLSDLKDIIKNEPDRVDERESDGNSEVWNHFKMLAVDGTPLPFAKCSNCEAVLIHSSKCGTSTLRKHMQTHIKDTRGKIRGPIK